MIEFSPLCIGRLNKSFALDKIVECVDSIHLDIMDETFVKSTAFSVEEINNFKTSKPKHVHIMSRNIGSYLKKLINVNSISFHYEAAKDHENLIKIIRDKGILPGIVLKSETSIRLIENLIPRLHRVILMAVPPGFSGQKFISSTTQKVQELREINKEIEIVIDGGMNEETMFEVTSCGANSCVVCSVIVKSNDYKKKIGSLKKMCVEGTKNFNQKK